MVDRLRLTSLDSNHLVLDIGLTYTKCGFSKDPMPMHIVPTPLAIVKNIRDNCSKLNTSTFAGAFQKQKQLGMELEEFLTQIFYHLLQTNPREKAVVVCESLMTQRAFSETLGHVLFKGFGVKSIYTFLANSLPLYAAGNDTGIVVEMGFQCAQIMPIVWSRVCMEAFQTCYTGGIHIEKNLNQLLMDDNKELLEKLPQVKKNDNFPSHIIEDLKIKALTVMQRDQRDEYLQNSQNLDKMKEKKYPLKRTYKEAPEMEISFFTRHTAMEACFGDPREDEENLAYSILKSIKKLSMDNRVRACQNIILSGGSFMVPGFKKRLVQEMRHLIQSKGEFEELKEIQELITVPENCFPPNCLVWVGASLLSSLNNEIDRFLQTHQDYIDSQERIPDRIGETFINGTRKHNYFNKEFEESLKVQKQILYSNTTPYSARSLASRREPIAAMLSRTIANMEKSERP